MFRLAIPAVFALGLLATEARAVIFLFLQDECDDHEAISAVRDDPAVKESRQRMDTFIKRLRPLKEKDFVALFGKATKKPAKTFAMPVAQARGLALSGLRYADKKMNKDHTDFHPVGDFAAIEVWYGIDGVTPVAFLLYFRTDEKFPKLTRDNLDKRLAWEQERLNKLIDTFEKRRAAVFVWEVDADREKQLYQGMESGDFAVKLQAMLRWGEQQGYRLVHRPARGEETPRWAWYRGDKLMAEAYHDRGFKGAEGRPCYFALYRTNGTRVRQEGGWPSLDVVRWYRPDGTQLRSESGSLLKESWRPDSWWWYNKDGEPVRSELDTNEDGVPDTYREGVFSRKDPGLPLAVERSWAVHPELIPEESRLPGQPERRVPLRKLKP